MNSNLDDLQNNDEISKIDEDRKKRNTCLLICVILILIMMLPSTLALLAIF